jgi:hypothetical protein
MSSHDDPRDHRLPPTQEEIDAWANREHQRRAAWLAGPSAEEKLAWARRHRWRSTLGLAESRLAPAPEEVDEWAALEHKRRAAWLEGPTDAEKQRWARAQRERGLPHGPDAAAPSQPDVEGWAAREKLRRQEWIAGPSEDERREWAERQVAGLFDDLVHLPLVEELMGLEIFGPERSAVAQEMLREVELAGKGFLHVLSRAPLGLWSYLVRAGHTFEQEPGAQAPRRRVRY